MMKQDHLTAVRITALKNGILSETEASKTLEHIGECSECALKYAESFSESELLELPAGFRSSVLARIEGEKWIPARKLHSGSKWELFGYSFRVGIAACITLFLLFSGTIDYGLGLSRTIHTDMPGIRMVTENLRGFSDRLVEFDITKYKKEV